MLTVDSDIEVDVAACQLRSSSRSIERATHDIAELAVEANRLAKDMVDGRVVLRVKMDRRQKSLCEHEHR